MAVFSSGPDGVSPGADRTPESHGAKLPQTAAHLPVLAAQPACYTRQAGCSCTPPATARVGGLPARVTGSGRQSLPSHPHMFRARDGPALHPKVSTFCFWVVWSPVATARPRQKPCVTTSPGPWGTVPGHWVFPGQPPRGGQEGPRSSQPACTFVPALPGRVPLPGEGERAVLHRLTCTTACRP